MNKYSDEQIIAEAIKFKTRGAFLKSHHYGMAWYRKLLPQIWSVIPPDPGPQSAYTNDELMADALKYPHRQAWKEAGKLEQKQGQASHYIVAKARGPEFMKRCCAHMSRATYARSYKYTEAELAESASLYQYKSQWKKACSKHYQAALGYGKDVLNRVSAHMTLASNPYAGDYIIYAYEFTDHHAYVGLTFKPEDRHQGHMAHGPVHDHLQVCSTYELKQVQVGIQNPQEAAPAEARWIKQYAAEGWTMLNTAFDHNSLGALDRKWTKELIIEDAQKYKTRKHWYLGHQYAYTLAHKMKWFDEAVAHMPRKVSVSLGPISEEKRKKLSEAKLGKKLSLEHRQAQREAQRVYWASPEGQARRNNALANDDPIAPVDQRLFESDIDGCIARDNARREQLVTDVLTGFVDQHLVLTVTGVPPEMAEPVKVVRGQITAHTHKLAKPMFADEVEQKLVVH